MALGWDCGSAAVLWRNTVEGFVSAAAQMHRTRARPCRFFAPGGNASGERRRYRVSRSGQRQLNRQCVRYQRLIGKGRVRRPKIFPPGKRDTESAHLKRKTPLILEKERPKQHCGEAASIQIEYQQG